MTLVAGVHGIRNIPYYLTAKRNLPAAIEAISADWATWLGEGLRDYDPALPVPKPLPVAYYSDCLNRGVPMGLEDPESLEPFAQELFVEFVTELRRAEVGELAEATAQTGQLARLLVKQPAHWLARERGKLAVRLVSALCADLATYFGPGHEHRRHAARDRVAETIRQHRPRVLVTHSLGCIVAYEALAADPELRLDLLVTLGCPLGVPNVVFERLDPAPGERGRRPHGVASWVSIADRGDPIAIPQPLSSKFIGVDVEHTVSVHPINPHGGLHYLRNRRLAQTLEPYLA